MDFFTPYYPGPAFALFGAAHLGALAATLLASLVLAALFYRGRNERLRPLVRLALAAFCALNIVAWDGWQLAYGLWSLAYSLPLHICTLSVWLSLILLLTRHRLLYELLYFWGLAGATQALLTPDLGLYGFPHFRFWIFFTSHAAIIVTVIYMTFAEGYRPRWASLLRVALITLGLMALVGIANALTGGNYMYIARHPETPSLIDLFGPWPWYIPVLVLIGLALFVVCYLPFAITDWLRRGTRDAG